MQDYTLSEAFVPTQTFDIPAFGGKLDVSWNPADAVGVLRRMHSCLYKRSSISLRTRLADTGTVVHSSRTMKIVDLLISHGCDIDFCPYCECTPLYSATYHNTELIKFMIEKGADPNTVSWIALDEIPSTPLDSIADDISAYGADPDLQESFSIIEEAGGKYFSDLVPHFYAYEE